MREWRAYRGRTIDGGVGWSRHMPHDPPGSPERMDGRAAQRRRMLEIAGKIDEKMKELEEILEWNRKRQDELVASRDGVRISVRGLVLSVVVFYWRSNSGIRFFADFPPAPVVQRVAGD